MGNSIFKEDGVVLNLWHYNDSCIIHYSKGIHVKYLVLKQGNKNYDKIVNTIQINKAYTFTIKDGFPLDNTLLDIEEPEIHKMIIKIDGFKDLSNNCKALNGMTQLLCSGTGLQIITDISKEQFIIGESYEIEYKIYGVNMLNLLLSYEKVKMI